MSNNQKNYLTFLISKVLSLTLNNEYIDDYQSWKIKHREALDKFLPDFLEKLLEECDRRFFLKYGKKDDRHYETEDQEIEITTVENLTKQQVVFCIIFINENLKLTFQDKQRINYYFYHDGKTDFDQINKLLKASMSSECNEECKLINQLDNDYGNAIPNRIITKIEDLRPLDYIRLIKQLGWLTMSRIKNFNCNANDYIHKKTNKYELGYEKYAKIFYLKFYLLWMTDLDEVNQEQAIERIEGFCQDNPTMVFALYKTKNGFHIFCLSHPIYHQSIDNIVLQEKFGADRWYVTFSYNYAYKIRISHKVGDPNQFIAKRIGLFGTGKKLEFLEKQLDFHDRLMELNLKTDSSYKEEIEPIFANYDL